MDDELYYLNQSDRDVFQDMAREFRSRRPSAGKSRHEETQDNFAPEVYVARTPAGGIAALNAHGTGTTDDVPGSAECNIYRVLSGGESGTGSAEIVSATYGTKVVYNLSGSSVAGASWIVVVRDKYGTWFVGTGTGGATGDRVGHVRITEYIPDVNGYYPGRLQILVQGPPPQWVDSVLVKVFPTEADTFIPNKRYGPLKYEFVDNGTPVYSGAGNQKALVHYCVAGVNYCDEWFILEPFEANINTGCSGTGSGTIP